MYNETENKRYFKSVSLKDNSIDVWIIGPGCLIPRYLFFEWRKTEEIDEVEFRNLIKNNHSITLLWQTAYNYNNE